MAQCKVCSRQCELGEGQTGFCGARININGEVTAKNYGKLTSLALDPIEKKPLNRFFPGSKILSLGSYGCDLRCPFCQNSEISWSDKALSCDGQLGYYSPEKILAAAKYHKKDGNIGAAFTYNEPLVGWEYVRDTGKLIHKAGMKNVLVTGGTAELWVLDELSEYIDAMNIDLKSFSADTYKNVLKGDLDMVKAFISKAVMNCHVELTTLIVPGMNDSEGEMRQISSWIAELCYKSQKDIPLHISRFFPRFKMTDRKATDIGLVYHLADIAREKLKYVYTGNC